AHAAASRTRMSSTAEPNRSVVVVAGNVRARSQRRRGLPATGLPRERTRRRTATVVSILVHALINALLIRPIASHEGEVIARAQGAGGAGPAGGGGGGHLGSGGVSEHVDYVRVAATPAAAPTVTPLQTPPKATISPPKPLPPVKPALTPAVQPTPAVVPPIASMVTPS